MSHGGAFLAPISQMEIKHEADQLAKCGEEAAAISLKSRRAYVYRMRTGRYVATETGPHLVAGEVKAIYFDGVRV